MSTIGLQTISDMALDFTKHRCRYPGVTYRLQRPGPMALTFNTILENEGIDPATVRLLRHQDQRADKGKSPYSLWRTAPDQFVRYQSLQDFGNRARLGDAGFWAAFVVTPEDQTLFAALYRVTYQGVLEDDRPRVFAEGIEEAGSCDRYHLAPDPRLAAYEGRLVVDWGPGTRSWIQRAERQPKPVREIRAAIVDPPFPGFIAFGTRLSQLDTLPPAWVTALSSVQGVYLLTCPETHTQYVGMATGEAGFWGRWQAYRDGHGGNVAMAARGPTDYEIAILEVAASTATPAEVMAREALWKRKLHSREAGLNRN